MKITRALAATLTIGFASPSWATCPPAFAPNSIGPDADCIFRDYNTDGVASTGVYNPKKSEIRQWGGVIGSNFGSAAVFYVPLATQFGAL